jgi:serine/threonine protein kinase
MAHTTKDQGPSSKVDRRSATGKPPRSGGLLSSKDQSGSESRLVEVLDAYLAAAHEGRAPTREELLANHPEMAEDLEACLASLEFIRQASLSAPALAAGAKPDEANGGETGLGDLGDFHLVAEVGRGGMGVVYEAIQRSLNRRVALKVLPFAAAMDPTQLRRFQTEALAAAQLHHTHIVPVYSVGCERGVHYYAMQFIEGQTLAQAIADRRRMERPSPGLDSPRPHEAFRLSGAGHDATAAEERRSPDLARSVDSAPLRSPSTATLADRGREFFRTAATLGIQASEALDHAHKLGIVHRDIKPANLLIDVAGSLWITDFGLARLQDDAGLTMTGDLLGTLRYMSPEQALAKRGYLDHRTDIYSLGATLYELLTLRPAVEGQDRQEVLRKIAQDEPAPPRRLNPSIPRELETILLKAMSKEPQSRYATAQELAVDLDRFLEHKPIRAKRPSLLERTAKWSRRHRITVATAFLFLLVAVVALAASSLIIARKQREVEKQRDEARQAVDDMYVDVAQEWLAQRAALEPMQHKFLQKALGYYQRFGGDDTNEPSARLRTAVAYRRVGEIQEKLGHHREAKSAYRRAAKILEGLAAQEARPDQYVRELATSEGDLARLLSRTGHQREAQPLALRAIDRLERLVGVAPSAPQNRFELARAHMLVTHLGTDGRTCERAYRRAIELLEKLAADSPSMSEYRLGLARAHSCLGLLLRDFGRPADAAESYRRAIHLGEKLVSEFPYVPDYARALALSLDDLAQLGGFTDNPSEIEQLFRRAIELGEKLAAGSPTVPLYKYRLAGTWSNFGNYCVDRGKLSEAVSDYRRAISLLEELVAALPSSIDYQTRLTMIRNNLADTLRLLKHPAAAELECRSAISQAQRLPTEVTSAPKFQRELAIIHITFAEVMQVAGRPRDAKQATARAIALLQKLSDAQSRADLAWILSTTEFTQLRDPHRAVRAAKQSIVQRPRNSSFWTALGAAHFRGGEMSAAIEALEKSRHSPRETIPPACRSWPWPTGRLERRTGPARCTTRPL